MWGLVTSYKLIKPMKTSPRYSFSKVLDISAMNIISFVKGWVRSRICIFFHWAPTTNQALETVVNAALKNNRGDEEDVPVFYHTNLDLVSTPYSKATSPEKNHVDRLTTRMILLLEKHFNRQIGQMASMFYCPNNERTLASCSAIFLYWSNESSLIRSTIAGNWYVYQVHNELALLHTTPLMTGYCGGR